ncbi:hypothetical protein PROFUN_00247 [Planoprotostelium fungivorum]|uniref:Uncharacterized protein n=1 Tax=Planoprotostelium fungivorum TaxID=1890364 RepID=A0A2P6NXV6_9EUKA|nr:hypothetical protein PROFUN_00247 [Planoprotostelium fungivorum]
MEELFIPPEIWMAILYISTPDLSVACFLHHSRRPSRKGKRSSHEVLEAAKGSSRSNPVLWIDRHLAWNPSLIGTCLISSLRQQLLSGQKKTIAACLQCEEFDKVIERFSQEPSTLINRIACHGLL